MKKFLSLVLALVMTMSLVTVSAGAKDYADASDIEYVEAVDVLSAIGVLEGDANGFRPNDTLKRSEAAKIICALNLTPKTAASLTADTAPFADVAKSHWAAGYIAEGVQSGIINGVGDNKFNPDGQLTGYAFLKMLLVSLGYDAAVEGFTGANWSVNVAKLAKKAGLTDGNDDFVGSKAVTREEAALYALNALEAYTVSYESKGTQITINGAVIATGASAATVSKTEQYMEAVYEDDLVKYTVADGDDLGRPAHAWKYDGEKVGTYASTADYTLTLTGALTDYSAKYTSLPKYLDGEEILEDAAYALDKDKKVDVNWTVNGDPAAVEDGLKAGSIVEIFADDETITDVVVINYELGKITKVDTSVKKADAKEGVSAYLTIKDIDGNTMASKVLDTEFAGYNTTDYVKNAYILYVLKDGEVLAAELAEIVEGKVTAKSGDKVAIDGTYYENVATETIAKKAEGKFFLNAAGQIMEFDAKSTASDAFAYVYKLVTDKANNADGVEVTSTTAYVVLTDGTKTSYVVSDDTDVTPEENKAYPYALDDDEIIFEDVTARTDDITITYAESAKIDKKNAEAADQDLLSSTEFIFAYWNTAKTKVTVKTATGYKNVNVTANVAVIADDGEALYVFADEKNGNATSDTEYAVLLSDDVVETWDDDDDAYYTYTVAVDGKETELTVKAANKLDDEDMVLGGVYAFVMNGDYAEFEDELVGQYGDLKVTAVNDDYFKAGSNYEYDEEVYYTITMEYDADEELESVEVDEGADLAKNDYVVLVVEDGDLSIVFVYDIID